MASSIHKVVVDWPVNYCSALHITMVTLGLCMTILVHLQPFDRHEVGRMSLWMVHYDISNKSFTL